MENNEILEKYIEKNILSVLKREDNVFETLVRVAREDERKEILKIVKKHEKHSTTEGLLFVQEILLEIEERKHE
jgi:hypothetical protein